VNEEKLVTLWNDKRRQLIQAQLHSVIGLSVLTVLAVMGYFSMASITVAIFALLFILTVGGLGLLSQFAVIREAKSVVAELSTHDSAGAVAKTIAASGRYLGLTQVLMTVFSIALLVSFVAVAFSL
jgi:uncharacterized iron-regulated membrane protein